MRSVLFFLLFLFSCFTLFAQAEKDTTIIYFPFDKHYLTPEAKEVLDKFLSDNKNAATGDSIIINGFCDIKGSNAYNDVLSRKRAFTVHEYLLNNGMSKLAFSQVSGYGKRKPVNDNSTPDERQINRRVEIIRKLQPVIEEVIIPEKKTDVPVKISTDTIAEFSSGLMDSIKVGQTLRLKNINFYNGRHIFLPQSRPALTELLDVMKTYPNLVIEIQGHICCHIGLTYDAPDLDTGEPQLSVNRARAVYEYLVENGIEPERMSYKGFAGRIPLVNPELTEEDRTANRRVEIKIISK